MDGMESVKGRNKWSGGSKRGRLDVRTSSV